MTDLHGWDLLSNRFDTHKDCKEIHPDAAVNIFVGWPIFFSQIKKQCEFLGKNNLSILDFGCGTGSLCKEYFEQEHTVTGMDTSEKMLEIAKQNLAKGIKIINVSEYDSVFNSPEYVGKFDVITSMHSFEWIENLDDTLTKLSTLLNGTGIILFAVFPKEHVIDSLKIKDLFEDFDNPTNPHKGYANFDGVRIPVYIREPAYFDRHFEKLGFEKLFEEHPQYPKEFLERYIWTGSKYPEMMVLAYRKGHLQSLSS